MKHYIELTQFCRGKLHLKVDHLTSEGFHVGNKAKCGISKRVFEENKARQEMFVFRKIQGAFFS